MIQEGTEQLAPVKSSANKYGIHDDEDDDEAEDEDDDDLDALPKSTKSWDAVSYFEDVVVWGHEIEPDLTSDPFVSGLRDWIQLSHLVCLYSLRSLF